MKIHLLAVLISSIIFLSCGDGNSKEKKAGVAPTLEVNKKEVKKKKVVKTILQRKEEGLRIREELNRLGVQIPENLIFSESLVNAMAIKKSVFIADNVDENIKKQLDDWFTKQSKDLVTANWEKIVIQKNESISGLLFNSYSFKKAQGGKSTLSDMLSLTSVYDPKNMTYTIYVKPYLL